MDRSFPRLLVLFCLLAPRWMAAQGTVKNFSIFSPALGAPEALQIYLPEGYDSTGTTTYPVVYFLHGSTLNFSSYPCLLDALDLMISSGEIHPMIVVKPNGSQGPYLGSMYTNSSLNGNVEDCIVNDVISYIDTHYKTKADRQHRCIFGHSMGANGSAQMALKYPGKFRAFAALSGVMDFSQFYLFFNLMLATDYPGGPPYTYMYQGLSQFLTSATFSAASGYSPDPNSFPPVEFPLDSLGHIIPAVMAKWYAFDPARKVVQSPPGDSLGIYFDCGEQDELKLYPMNLGFRDSLQKAGADFVFRSFTGGHSNQVCNRISLALQYLDSMMLTPIVSASEKPVSEKLRLYPNPANDEITAPLGLEMPREAAIFDMQGRRIISIDVRHATAKIDIHALLPGIYLLKIAGPDGVRVGKFIKRS